jgi:NAD(P)-dependent dehydrogenase (short-subunit alcohol dehydrogenase family)
MAQFPLQGRTIFVTGGASGIGAEVARQAAKRGARLALVDVDLEGAQRVAAELPSAIAIHGDVRDYESLEAAVAKTVETFGGIDVAMANAGIESAASARAITLGELERIADINFTGVLRTVRAVMPQLIDRRGYLLITASAAAIMHAPPLSHYAATKAGVEAFGDAVRIEVAHKGVEVGVAYFALIDTPMVARGKADPILAEFEQRNGTTSNPLGKTYSLGGAGAAVIRGIERRARRVIYPRFLRAFMVMRSAMPRVIERALAREKVSDLVDALDARDLAELDAPSPSQEHQERLLS